MYGKENMKIGANIYWFVFLASILVIGSAKANNESKLVEIFPTKLLKPLVWPKRALESKKSGWVKFQFDVSASGKPINVEMIDAKPRRIFERKARAYFPSGLLFDADKGKKTSVIN